MGLAPIFVERVFETIVEINKQGTTILLVEQNAMMEAAKSLGMPYRLAMRRIVLPQATRFIVPNRSEPSFTPNAARVFVTTRAAWIGAAEFEEVMIGLDNLHAEDLLPDVRDLVSRASGIAQRSCTGLSSVALSPSSVIQTDRSSAIVELALFGTTATRSPTREPLASIGVDHRVVVVQAVDQRLGAVGQQAVAFEPPRCVAPECLAARVHHDALAVDCDHRRHHGQRELVAAHRAERELLAVAEDVCAGAVLGRYARARVRHRRRRPGADMPRLEPCALERNRRLAQHAPLLLCGLLRPSWSVGVSGIAQHADDIQPLPRGDPRERCAFLRRYA